MMKRSHHGPVSDLRERDLRRSLSVRARIIRRDANEPPRAPNPIKCGTCCDLSHRRMGVCAECGEAYQAERIER